MAFFNSCFPRVPLLSSVHFITIRYVVSPEINAFLILKQHASQKQQISEFITFIVASSKTSFAKSKHFPVRKKVDLIHNKIYVWLLSHTKYLLGRQVGKTFYFGKKIYLKTGVILTVLKLASISKIVPGPRGFTKAISKPFTLVHHRQDSGAG